MDTRRKILEIRRLLDELAAEIEENPTVAPVKPEKAPTRIRTIPEAVREIKETDPKSCLTVPTLRRRVKEGRISTVTPGKTAHINMAELEIFLKGGKFS